METSSCTTGLLCFHSSNRPCAIPKSVSGSGYQKTIVCCLSIFSGVYLGNGRRCRYCISLIGNFLCTFIQQVRGYVGIPHFVSKSEDLMAYQILFWGKKIFDCRNGKDRKKAWKRKRKEMKRHVYGLLSNH